MFFSGAALVTFGGAYAVLAYVAQRAVEVYGWLSPAEMVRGLALAETTPGPLIMFNTTARRLATLEQARRRYRQRLRSSAAVEITPCRGTGPGQLALLRPRYRRQVADQASRDYRLISVSAAPICSRVRPPVCRERRTPVRSMKKWAGNPVTNP